MIEWLHHIDLGTFRFINGTLGCSFLDPLMMALSSKWIWIPFYAVMLWALVKKYKRQVIWVLLILGVVVTLSDGISSKLLKPSIQRLRPNQIEKTTGAHMLDVRAPDGGDGNSKYGFPSSHAANSMAIFLFAALFLELNRKYTLILLIFPVFISISRVYLGVHYPSDVAAGMLLGAMLTLLAWKLYGKCLTRFCEN